MTEIKLLSLHLVNFKGQRDYFIEFTQQTTSIFGDNGTGKSTLFDAFTWLLFGKDSHDIKDFNIKTLGPDGQPIPRIPHSVEGVLITPDGKTALKRVYEEKWVRRRGSEIEEMSGHETTYFHNGVPMTAGQYSQIIANLVNDTVFKLITSPTYFNSLPWKDRRQTLVKMAGTITPESVVAQWNPTEATEIIDIINGPKKIDEVRREQASARKRLNDGKDQIRPRIDEVQKTMPEADNYEAIEASITRKQDEFNTIDASITDQVKAFQAQNEAEQRRQNDINAWRRRMNELQFQAEQDAVKVVNDAKIAKDRLIADKQRAKAALDNLKSVSLATTISETEANLDKARAEWSAIQAEVMPEITQSFECPTCKQPLPAGDVAAKRQLLTEAFEQDKAARLARNRREGESLATSLTQLREQQAKRDKEIEDLQFQYDSIDPEAVIIPAATEPVLPQEYYDLKARVDQAEPIVATPLNVDELKRHRSEIQAEIDGLRRKLITRDQRTQAQRRIEELKAQESTLAQQLAQIERIDNLCSRYVTDMMSEVESRVNGLFSLVKWKMFDVQINGGIEDTCECMIDGVPYSDLNSAGKIRAGIDCINALTRFFDVCAPVWVDNRESVNDIPVIQSQIINLHVSYDKVLTIK